MTDTLSLPISESSQVGEARRSAASLARRLGFDATESEKLALVVTEVAGNLIAHAGGGEVVLRVLPGEDRGLEILALDRGPGMRDVARCLSDGYSTTGTSGNGLGAVVRLSDQFDIYSMPGNGTAVLARCWSPPGRKRPPAGFQIGGVCLPVTGEEVCGDAWAVEVDAGRTRILLADGLGHGLAAAEASRAAVATFRKHGGAGPKQMVERIHAALQGTRGAAVAVAEVDPERQSLRFAGVGNISGYVVVSTGSSGLVSHNGIAGHRLTRVQEFEYPWPAGACLVMHSDGLQTKWRLDQYPGLATRDPSLIAGVLYRDFTLGRDDVTVLVAREALKEGAVP